VYIALRVVLAQRDRGFGPVLREWETTGACTATHDDRESALVCPWRERGLVHHC